MNQGEKADSPALAGGVLGASRENVRMHTAIPLVDFYKALLQDIFYSQPLFIEEITSEQIDRIGANSITQDYFKRFCVVDAQFSWQGYFIYLIFHDERKYEDINIDINNEVGDLNPQPGNELAKQLISVGLEKIAYASSEKHFNKWLCEMNITFDIKEYFRRNKFPLPSLLFPGEPDNTINVSKMLNIPLGGWRVYFRNADVRNVISTINTASTNISPEIDNNASRPIGFGIGPVHPVEANPQNTKRLLDIAAELLRSGKINNKERCYILAFKYRETPNLPWGRAYKDLPGVGNLSKNPKTQERNFYAWAEKGKKICQGHAAQ